MSYLTGARGNTVYLINTDDAEAYAFNTFGQGISRVSERDAKIALMGNYKEVDVVSVIGSSNNQVCNVYYNGYTTDVNKMYLHTFILLRDNLKKVNGTMFKIEHKDKAVTQIILPIFKDSTNITELSSILNINKESWLKNK